MNSTINQGQRELLRPETFSNHPLFGFGCQIILEQAKQIQKEKAELPAFVWCPSIKDVMAGKEAEMVTERQRLVNTRPQRHE